MVLVHLGLARLATRIVFFFCVQEEGKPRDEHQNFRSTESWLQESQPAEIVSIYFVPMVPLLVPAVTGRDLNTLVATTLNTNGSLVQLV